MMYLIGGYNSTKVHDDEGLANLVGSSLYLMGIVTFFTGVADYYYESAAVETISAIIIFLISIYIIWRDKQYTDN